MTSMDNRTEQTAALRRRAESRAFEEREAFQKKMEALSPEATQEMLHELRVHQIELEIQNEELRRTQVELDAARMRYFDLYDLAPVAYCILSAKGLILEANLTVATLLGAAREALIRQPLSRFIVQEDQDVYYLHRRQIRNSSEPCLCQLRMMNTSGAVFWMQLATIRRQSDGTPVYWVTLSDVTGQKEVEETLRESEAGFRNLLHDVQSVAVQGYGPEGTAFYWNQASEQLYGYSAQEALGRNLLDLIIPSAMRGAVELAIRQMAETGQPIPASELSLLRKDGSCVEVYSSHTLIKVPGREPELFCIDIDLTEQKQVEKALAKSEMKYRMLADSGQVLIRTCDQNKQCDYVNEPWLRFTGRTLDQEIGNGWWEGVHPEDRERCQSICCIAFVEREPFNMEYRLRNAGGEYRWIEEAGTPRCSDQGSFFGYIGHCLDITDRKQADRQLLLIKEQYRSLVENSHGIIYTISPEGVVTYVSPSYTRLLGHDPSAIIGKNFRNFVHPDDIAACEVFQQEVLGAGVVREGLEYRIFHCDGSVRWHFSNFIPCYNEENEIVSFVGNAMDVTAQKQSQAELGAARATAENASRAKSEFLALISHEIRTPLNALVGFSALARKTNDLRLLQEYLNILDHSSRILMDLVNDVLDMSKIEVGQLDLESIPFNLTESFDLLAWQYAPLAAQEKLAFHVVKEEGLPRWVTGDPLRFRQVVSNLIANAIKFTASGNITLTLSATASIPEEGWFLVRLAVQDTGIGIAKDKLPSLFQPFRQIDPSITRKYGGTGLGLAIVQSLVKLMQGRIEITSEEGRGSCFVVELPFPVADPPYYKKMVTPSVVPVAILVVEDNAFNRRFLADILTSWGHSVTEAENALQALGLMELCPYDLIVVDVRMAGMDGIELAGRIRGLERDGTSVPIIACTADTGGATREQCLAAGMQAVLIKPIDADALARAISELCCRPPSVVNDQAKVEPIPVSRLTERIVIDMGYDSAQMQEYLQLLGEDIHAELHQLESAVGAEDRSLLRAAAHSLKGLCGHLQDRRPVELARQLHDASLTLPFSELQDAAKQLCSVCRRLAAKE